MGIVIHVTVGKEKRTEFFSDERLRIGSDKSSDLQIRTDNIPVEGLWFELEAEDNFYRIVQLAENSGFLLNGEDLRRYVPIRDGDVITSSLDDVSFAFFSLNTKTSLITTNREQRQFAHFIEEAALDASPKRDEAKAFLREFVRELSREISWTTKLILLTLAVSFIGGVMYLGVSFNNELKNNRKESEEQSQVIKKLEEQLAKSNEQLGEIDKSTRAAIDIVSLAPNLSVQYGNGVCLIVGVYDLVDRRSGKVLRYPDPAIYQPDPYEPVQTGETGESGETAETQNPAIPQGLTTEGTGTIVEYDFIGTGFHVGSGFLVTNRHVLQPWEEDDTIKQLMKQSSGRPRVKRLFVYFPGFPQAFPIKVQRVNSREDLGIASIDPNFVSPDIPVLPLDEGNDSVAIGKTVVTMGYPNGPDRLLAMLDDSEIKSINSKFGGSRQALLNYLAQAKKITPLTTPGAITDLNDRRIVHDAKTAEGGSGAPLFGQSGKVIGVNFGVFTESAAANMAVPIKFAIDMLKNLGWQSPSEIKQNQAADASNKTPDQPQDKPASNSTK